MSSEAVSVDRPWDGQERCYKPGPGLNIAGTVDLHRPTAEELDPFTYEVVRSALQTINFEHGDLLQRLSVSPITMLGRDFQASILLEDGEPAFFGPDVQYFSVAGDLTVKWILEHRSANPGIAPGDVFLGNDPFISAPHQHDATVVQPVFVGEQIFCWVANTLHYADLGGISPGSFCPTATDIWSEPTPMPPFRLAEGGQLREDLLALFVRQSRLPATVNADLRAALAAAETTAQKVAALVDRYGADTVKLAAERTVLTSERVFAERLAGVPDGAWSHRGYCEAAFPGDSESYCFQINITKRDGRLEIDNRGSSPQKGSTNAPYVTFVGAVFAALSGQITPDLGGCFGGIGRRLDFNPVSGTVCTPEWPAAISTAGVYANFILVATATAAVAKMLLSGDDDARARAVGIPTPQAYLLLANGVDADGRFFVLPHLDFHIGSPGGMMDRDGPDAGGHYWIPGVKAPNIEETERQFPVLHLYRRFLAAGADGAGAFRGGLGGSTAVVPWKAKGLSIGLQLNESYPKGGGDSGGNPGSKARVRVRRGAHVHRAFEEGKVPQDLDLLDGEDLNPRFKDVGIDVAPGEVYEFTWPNSAGHGDPLLRDPIRVAADVRAGLLDADTAARVFGVIVTTGGLDEKQTDETRRARRDDRLRTAIAPSPGQSPPRAEPRSDAEGGLCVAGGGTEISCEACGHVLASGGGANYKDRTPTLEVPIAELAPEFHTSDRETSSKMVHREFLCPSCGTRCGTEIARAADEPLWDIRLT